MPRALICGVSGQDGAYLAQLLILKGYEVFGTSRDAEMSVFANLVRLGIRQQVHLLSMTLTDSRSVFSTLTAVQPDEIYNLAGQSSVGLSFSQPAETLESIALGTLNLLEAIRVGKWKSRLYNAASGDCYGETTAIAPAWEDAPLRPRSPYGVAKAAAFWEVASYREAYGMFACSGLLFNHESILRPARFVTKKIVATAVRIAAGSAERLVLGDTRVVRDWGWAPEYVEAMWLMMQADAPRDYVIATGESHSLQTFIEIVFDKVGLRASDNVETDLALMRAADIQSSYADPSRAANELGWKARTRLPELVSRLVEGEAALTCSTALGQRF